MQEKILLHKAEENYNIAQLAEERGFYDVASSRYYYCIYEKILFISKMRGINYSNKGNKGPHQATIEQFTKDIKDELSDEQMYSLMQLELLRQSRNRADYTSSRIRTKKSFNHRVKKIVLEIDGILSKILERNEASV